jgi:DNA-binding NarL/FixJ family response regulator
MESNNQVRVLLADDHRLLRDALATLINSYEGFCVVGKAGTGREVIQFVEEGLMPDIILLDLNMPDLDGYDTAIWLNQHYPDIRVLVLTMYDSEVVLMRLLQVGVCGMIKKDVNPNEMLRALTAVATDGFYYSPHATGRLGCIFRKQSSSSRELEKAFLSEQEIRFLKLASTDLTYKEVAREMNITVRAVDSLRDQLFEKLDVKSRVGLAVFAMKKGILTV